MQGVQLHWMLMVAWLPRTRWMSNWAGKLVSMCLCKGTELLATARSTILFPIGRLALFEEGPPESLRIPGFPLAKNRYYAIK